MTAADVALVAEARERRPGEWESGCPVCGHGSGRRLAITGGDSGRVLIYPRCGCDTRDVLQALGLEWADLMPDRPARRDPEAERRQRARLALKLWRAWKLTTCCRLLRGLDQLERGAGNLLRLDSDQDTAWNALALVYAERPNLEMDFDRLTARDESQWLAVRREDRERGKHAA